MATSLPSQSPLCLDFPTPLSLAALIPTARIVADGAEGAVTVFVAQKCGRVVNLISDAPRCQWYARPVSFEVLSHLRFYPHLQRFPLRTLSAPCRRCLVAFQSIFDFQISQALDRAVLPRERPAHSLYRLQVLRKLQKSITVTNFIHLPVNGAPTLRCPYPPTSRRPSPFDDLFSPTIPKSWLQKACPTVAQTTSHFLIDR